MITTDLIAILAHDQTLADVQATLDAVPHTTPCAGFTLEKRGEHEMLVLPCPFCMPAASPTNVAERAEKVFTSLDVSSCRGWGAYEVEGEGTVTIQNCDECDEHGTDVAANEKAIATLALWYQLGD